MVSASPGARLAAAAKLVLLLAVVVWVGVVDYRHAGNDLERTEDGRIIIRYWEKWQNFEAEAMQRVVDAYNTSQNKYYVKYLTTSEIQRKLLLATAGGNPPEVAGFWSDNIVQYVDNGTLMPLDSLMKKEGIGVDDYLPAVIATCQYRGFTWGLPTTPATLALHYNRALFREAGLDPDRPPRTIDELNEYARKLTKRDENGVIVQLGFTPMIPNWWQSTWIFYWGARYWNGVDEITCDSPEAIACFKWARDYAAEYGADDLKRFQDSWGENDSVANPFFAGKLAMQLQGVWNFNFINKYSPDLDWAAAPFPTATEELAGTTFINADMLVIPKGCRSPEGAWDFIRFTQRPEMLELLNLGQGKFSPLREVSPEFYSKHPNPEITLFRRLAESERAFGYPMMTDFEQYRDEINVSFERAYLGLAEPTAILRNAKSLAQRKLDQSRARWELVADRRLEEWSRQ